jgi:hypothetical protein
VSAKRIILLVVGVLVALIGLGMAAGGGAMLWINETQRDDEGFFTTRTERFAGGEFAVTSERVDLGFDHGAGWFGDMGDLAEVRVRATSADPAEAVFIGIGRADDVETYLAGVPHSQVRDIDLGPFRVDYADRPGLRAPEPPGEQGFWVARAEGPGRQALRWPLEEGRWILVLMNADASAPVAADVTLGLKLDPLRAAAIGILIAGLLILALGATLVVLALHRRAAGEPRAPAAVEGLAVAGPYPLALRGDLQPDLSRWLWLVKWLLLIPHFLVLAVLWVVFFALTVVAFFAIVFTGRYPRGIFDINVGIMRWTWRVGFYGYSALGSDRYPPFSLQPTDHPATLEVAYPERLSRGLVWVKSWLLALPHLVIVAIFGTGIWWSAAWAGSGGWNDAGWGGWGGGLIGVLVLIAALWLLFANRYPRDLFDLVVGLNRWSFRVLAYVALMTDRYPPFRLDQGPREPGDRGAPQGPADMRTLEQGTNSPGGITSVQE